MNRVLPLVCAAALGMTIPMAAPARAQRAGAPLFRRGTPVVVLGRITSPPKGAVEEKKMQVAIGPEKTDYTLHFRNAELYGIHGQKIDEDGLDDGQWVRADGRVMNDPRRIEVRRVQVVAPDEPALKRSAFYRTGYDFGYVSAVADAARIFPAVPAGVVPISAPFTMVGRVADDTGAFERSRRIQVRAAGNVWTLHVPKESTVTDAKGEKLSVHEVKGGQWVRAYGWRTADLRMRVERMENIGADEAYQAATFYRKDFPLGYVESLDAEDMLAPLSVTGTVTSIAKDVGAIAVRDEAGRDQIVYTDNARITVGGQQVGMDRVRVGDKVTVEGRTIHFK